MDNRKGVMGLDTVKSVMTFGLVLSILAIAMFVALSSISGVKGIKDGASGFETSEVVGTVITENFTALARNSLEDCEITSTGAVEVWNASDGAGGAGVQVETVAFEVSGCSIRYTGLTGGNTSYNNSLWNVTYHFKHNIAQGISTNISNGTAGFFTNIPTVFVILGAVVIILAVTLILFAVNRFGGSARSL